MTIEEFDAIQVGDLVRPFRSKHVKRVERIEKDRDDKPLTLHMETGESVKRSGAKSLLGCWREIECNSCPEIVRVGVIATWPNGVLCAKCYVESLG